LIILASLAAGCSQEGDNKTPSGASALPSTFKDEPKYRQSYAFGLIMDGKIKEGKTTIADLKELFKDYSQDLVVWNNTKVTFYFFPMPPEGYKIRDSDPQTNEAKPEITYYGRYLNFLFNRDGVLETITISSTHKGVIDKRVYETN
jgi:hypothetical protein